MTTVDDEVQLFEQETTTLVDFSYSLLSQLPEDSATRLQASKNIQNCIDTLCDQFIQAASEVLTVGCEKCVKAAAEQIESAQHIRALRCYFSSRLWRLSLRELHFLASDAEKREILQILDDGSYDESFRSYQDAYLDAKKEVYSTFTQVTSILKDNEKTLSNSERQLTSDVISQAIAEKDNLLIKAASRCDELLDEIFVHNQKVVQGQSTETIKFNASKVSQQILKPKANPRLLTLKQTIFYINEFWDAKAKNDAACKKQGRSIDTARQFLASFYKCKIGTNKKIMYPKYFAYSAGFYSQYSAICAIFIAEIQSQVDEAFKLLCLEYEKKITAIAKAFLKRKIDEKCNIYEYYLSEDELREIADRSCQITGFDCYMILKKLYSDKETSTLQEFLNLIDLKSLAEHKQKLSKLSTGFKYYDEKALQRLNKDNFVKMVKENYPQCDGALLYEQTTNGHSSITFTQAVFALGPVILNVSTGQSTHVNESKGLDMKDLK